MILIKSCFLLGFFFALPLAFAESTVTFGGFVDTYYAYDFNQPTNHDRSYTTQPARHNEFNVNLAYIDAKVNAERIRGRFALQAGTSVQSNYSGEPTQGSVSGPSLSRHVQEAVIGYKVTDKLWIDGGIYFSHIGFEGFISKDNWTYTRSLAGDFSPYYQSGVKAGYQWNDRFFTSFHVINGWQNISENNEGKALGLQMAYAPCDRLTLTYNNFLGNEAGNRRRFFNDFILKAEITDKLQLAGFYDLGMQRNQDNTSEQYWHALGLFGRYAFTPQFSMTVRGERYIDKNQVIVTTGTANGFQTTGVSINADVVLEKQVLWRTEVREFWSKDRVFQAKTGPSFNDGFVVSSLSLGF